MQDASEETVRENERAQLVYPFDGSPEFGAAMDVAPSVKWLRTPLPGSLGAINIWAIRDGEGWAIVDTGIAGGQTRDAWRAALAGPLEGRPVTRVFVTHMHPDHIGMAGYLTRKFGVRLWITALEYYACRTLAADTGREAPEDALRFFRATGWDEDHIETYRTRFGAFGRALYALPDSFRRVEDGDEIRIGDHLWQVVVGRGHSPEHASYYCPALGVVITGDQVLPKISSNVSVFPTEPEADPLTEWLTTLAAMKTRVPADVLVLPAHNEPFHGLHARIDHLIGGHERGMQRVFQGLGEPRRAVDLFHHLFRRAVGDDIMYSLATGETVAHLNCLMARGRVLRERDAQGVDWYRAVA